MGWSTIQVLRSAWRVSHRQSSSKGFFMLAKRYLRSILVWLFCHNIISSDTTAAIIRRFRLEAE